MHILALKPECKILKGEKKLEVQKIVIYNTLWSLSFYILSWLQDVVLNAFREEYFWDTPHGKNINFFFFVN